MSNPTAYHAGYDAGVRNERKLCQQEIDSLKTQLAEVRGLLSSWQETWNDGFNPDGDLLDDTDKALAGQGGG